MTARGPATDTCEALRRFGHHLGLAFQIRDDILGIWGDPAEMGKPVGGDLLRRKRSLPVIHALSQQVLLRQGTTPEPAELRSALEATRLAKGASTVEEAAALAAEMEAGGSRAYCEQVAGESLATALAELDPLPLFPPHGARLRDLATYLAGRTR
jgi:geranylgeranyl diphosphate synthase type I